MPKKKLKVNFFCISAATATFLDLNLLRRDKFNKELSEEKAVLKQPLDLKKLGEDRENGKALDNNDTIDYDDRQPFPDEPDKRGIEPN